MEELDRQIQILLRDRETFAVKVVDLLLSTAMTWGASDLHLLPEESGAVVRSLFRMDGVLQQGPTIPLGQNVISRLKVLSNLLTYRTDVPQEGRLKGNVSDGSDSAAEIRVSTFPTIHGEKGVVRFFIGSSEYRLLADLGLPESIFTELESILAETSGLFLACGPAGSGKTTTLYAALRHLQQSSVATRSLCTLEDPVEAVIPGVCQSQVRSESGFTYERGIMSLMRQDPDVIMVGEIRDRQTAEVVLQAALTGHLVLSSFHSASASDAISRLLDLGMEPYVLRSTLSGLLAQRLLHRKCLCMSRHPDECPDCRGTGYSGRFLVAEFLRLQDAALNRTILERSDSDQIQVNAEAAGMVPLHQWALQAVEEQKTSLEECVRIFGPSILHLQRLPLPQ